MIGLCFVASCQGRRLKGNQGKVKIHSLRFLSIQRLKGGVREKQECLNISHCSTLIIVLQLSELTHCLLNRLLRVMAMLNQKADRRDDVIETF